MNEPKVCGPCHTAPGVPSGALVGIVRRNFPGNVSANTEKPDAPGVLESHPGEPRRESRRRHLVRVFCADFPVYEPIVFARTAHGARARLIGRLTARVRPPSPGYRRDWLPNTFIYIYLLPFQRLPLYFYRRVFKRFFDCFFFHAPSHIVVLTRTRPDHRRARFPGESAAGGGPATRRRPVRRLASAACGQNRRSAKRSGPRIETRFFRVSPERHKSRSRSPNCNVQYQYDQYELLPTGVNMRQCVRAGPD